MRAEANYIVEQIDRHHEWFGDSLPMIASENLISPLAREMLVSDFHDRYAEGLPGERYYHGNIYVDKVENKVMDLAKKLFKCTHADVRPTSGTVANLGVLKALGKYGDPITHCALSDGAHISTAKFGAVGLRGLVSHTYPFDTHEMNIDVDGARRTILEVKPKIALFGQSVFLFPSPIKELKDALDEVGCYVWYDGAHVLGLIAGGKFQDPLREGVEVITGSTHKTFPGPQHGIVIANPRDDKMARSLYSGIFPGVTSNHHLHAMAALGISLAEHLEFGAEYADQIIRNSQALGQALHEGGIKVLCEHKGFTASHIIAIDVEGHGGGSPCSQLLEDSNIIANMNMLPRDTKPKSPSGIRLGSQELTRLGMKESHMSEVADLIKRIIVDKEPTANVKKDVIQLKRDFKTIHYCFNEGHPAYDRFKLV
ncbi:MAG: serine hydroxymethyltransferase [Candidatus Thermoplasmatota archaeon]|nr:serine hydroxymethyltransferase [Candidatus Thermoplasmatota archaeon]MBU4070998.1 serine hydroxymethyltransferase [Candidatus Thermoplasmatota archaeon]MBU4143963.1 serine hydroxymethyltransferase [Candidatus Thermoplasmatota archaeon]MBU4592570.1 serine hydroxymethyltransferase [Candidatus Thermoplasmatota archaeon]